MYETVEQYFKSLHIARDIRDHVEFWNPDTREYVFRDPDFDTPEAWAGRGVCDVCCLSDLPEGEGGPAELYTPSGDRDVPIREAALRIATEDGWVRL